MTWPDPDEQRRRMSERFGRCAEQVDTARGKLKWVKLSVQGNFDPAITSRALGASPGEATVGETLAVLSGNVADLVDRLDGLFEALRFLSLGLTRPEGGSER